ncbi:hypothetical protein DIZ76_011521 [Coccidioides immitis]|nr:hypothetical protein DIZ76_011521 [Coccidioides immitis]
MDTPTSTNLPAQYSSSGPGTTPGVDQPLPLFPTIWTPRFNQAAALLLPADATGGGAGTDGAAPSSPREPSPTATLPRASNPSRIRRRNRMITSCLECRRRKLKCDRLHPCSSCSKSKRDCLFLAPATDAASRMKLTELKNKIGSLERGLERDAAARQGVAIRREASGDAIQERDHDGPGQADGIVDVIGKDDSRLPVPDDEKDLEPTPLAVQDAAYDDDADDESLDLGFKLGRMRMTDRIGGLYRPMIADELSAALGTLRVSDTPQKFAPTPSIDPQLLQEMSAVGDNPYFEPSASYVAPRSAMFFDGSQRYMLADFLPTRVAGDRLLQQYWEAVHPIAKIAHRQTFEKQYNDFWINVSNGVEPAFSLQALVFAAMFSAVVSMSEDIILSTFGVPQKRLIENFQLGTEMALSKANFLKTTKVQTLQALVMYLIPMCREEISRAHSVLVGTAIRLAECMGLHRDPEEYGLGPVECHVRRMIWYQLCFLDIQTSLLQGPRHSIRREDFSTKFPVNMDDSEISSASTDSIVDAPRWTDMTYMRIRIECNELRRLLLVDRIRIEKRQVSLTQVLTKIEAFRKATCAKYGPFLFVPNPKPIHRAAQLMLSILLCRAYISVLHRYANGVSIRMPDRLHQILISSGTQMLEDSIQLETSPDLRVWAWYHGALNQYHVALLLLMEIFASPMRREADRIWRCLDYVFETSSLAPDLANEAGSQDVFQQRDAKARLILTALRDRMTVYREMRKLKIPRSMVDSKVLFSERESSGSYTEPPPLQRAVPKSLASRQAQGNDISVAFSSELPGTTRQQHCQRAADLSSLNESIESQPAFPQSDTYGQRVPMLSPPLAQPLTEPSFLIPGAMQQHSSLPRQPVRAASHDSDRVGSEDSSSSNLWFVSETGLGTAGAASSIENNGVSDAAPLFPQTASGKPTAAIDIDWVSSAVTNDTTNCSKHLSAYSHLSLLSQSPPYVFGYPEDQDSYTQNFHNYSYSARY